VTVLLVCVVAVLAYLIGTLDGKAGRRPHCPSCAAWAREMAYIVDKEDLAGRATALLRTGVDPGVTAYSSDADTRRACNTASTYP
jgi:hypothetical protein